MDLHRWARPATTIILVAVCLFHLQFGLPALAHDIVQGILSLIGAAALGWGAVRHARRRAASWIVLTGTLPVLVYHGALTFEDPGELPFLVASIPVPLIAAARESVRRIA